MNTLKVFIITIVMITLAGCALDAPGPVSPEKNGTPPGARQPAAPEPIDVNSEEELASKSNYGYVIVKSHNELSAAFFADYGAVLADTMAVGTDYYHYVSKEEGIAALLAALNASGQVLQAEPDIVLKMHTASYTPVFYNDPYLFSSQYAAYVTDLKKTWETYGVGTNQVYAAVLDSGINMQHEEFAGVIHKGFSFFQRDASNYYSWIGLGADPIEMDFANWDNNYRENHGTRVAGVIAAKGNNGRGIAGVCPENVKLLVYKVIAKNPNGKTAAASGSLWVTFSAIKHLIQWKKDNGVTQTIPVNMSLGDAYASQFAIDLVNHGLDNDVVIIASSGNDGRNFIQYPASYPGVIAVGATGGDDAKAYVSNGGDYLSVTAPGMQIASADSMTNNGYSFGSGTSFSTPFVTGLAAYLLTFNPDLKPAQLKQLIEDGADDLGEAGFDPEYGYGRVNVYNTVRALLEGDGLDDPKYSDYALNIQVTNDTVPVENLNVYLYDDSGRYVTMAPTNQDGTAFFNLLKPGTYTAKANYLGSLGKAEAIDFENAAADVTALISFAISNRWFIQTLENDGPGSNITDTFMVLYDDQGTKLKEWDTGKKDTLEYVLEPGKTYVVLVTSFKGKEGHYSFSVSGSKKLSAPGYDPLTSSGNDQYEPNNSVVKATTVTPGEILNCFSRRGDKDYFTFTVPAVK